MEALLGVSGFLGLLVIAYLVLIIAAIVKFFQMANDVREIKHHLQQRNVSVRVSKQNDSDDFWSSDDDAKSGYQQTASSAVVSEAVKTEERTQHYSPLDSGRGVAVFKLSDGRYIQISTSITNTPGVGDKIVTSEFSTINGELIVSSGLKSWKLKLDRGVVTVALSKQEIELSSGMKLYYFSQNSAPIEVGDSVYLSSGQPVPDGDYILAERYGGDKLEIRNQVVVKGKKDNTAVYIVLGVIILFLILLLVVDF